MVRTSFYIFLVLLAVQCTASPALAQADTTIYQLKGVEIFGKPSEVYAVGSRVSSIDSSYLDTYASGSLANVLQARTPLYIRQYGPGGISTVTFRGTSAQHTAVLWNGLNIASPSLGQSDFTTLSLGGIGSVSVQHGGASAMYGSGAIGGAVLLNSPVHGEGLRASLQQEAGSYNRYYSKATASYGNEKISAGASFFWHTARNNFPYRDLSRLSRPEVRQEHAATLQKGFTQDLTWKLSTKGKLSIHTWFTDIEREIQPAMGAAHNNASYSDRNFRLLGSYDQQNWLGETSLKAAYFSDYLNYSSSNLTSVTAIKTYQAQAEQTYIYGRRWNLKAGANLQHYMADVDGYGGQVTENRAALFLLTRFDPTDRLSLTLNLRQAFADGFNPPPTPALGFNWKALKAEEHTFFLKGNVTGSYRLPTMNERYWQPGGVPDLKPEQGYQAEAGLTHILKSSSFKLETEVTPYTMLINNWVEWRTAGSVSTPVNLQRVRSQGVEFSSFASQKLQNWRLDATIGYTYSTSTQVASYEGNIEPGNQLAYIPKHKATLHTLISFKDWHVSGNLVYNSQRFTSGSNTTALNSFTLLDLDFGKAFNFGKSRLQTNIQVNNVTNTIYQTMQNYAMPPRNYNLRISYLISNPNKNQ